MLCWLQELYRAVPVLLSPVLGNPIALASFGLDPKASFPDKVCTLSQLPQGCLPTRLVTSHGQMARAHSWRTDVRTQSTVSVPPNCHGNGVQHTEHRALLSA